MGDCNNNLKFLCRDNLNKLIAVFIRNKFELLSQQIKVNVEVLKLMISLKVNDNSGGILLNVMEDIPSNLITVDINPIDNFYVVLNMLDNKWLINCSYNHHKSLIGNHLDVVSKTLDLHSSTYEKIILLGYFNAEIDEQHI